VPAAVDAGAVGILVDTADKRGPGLRALVDRKTLAAWVARAHDAGLFVTLAGRLTADDLPFVRAAGADIAGVRGAACDGGRLGRLSPEKVWKLRSYAGSTDPLIAEAIASGASAGRIDTMRSAANARSK